jgi:hypothetical protein
MWQYDFLIYNCYESREDLRFNNIIMKSILPFIENNKKIITKNRNIVLERSLEEFDDTSFNIAVKFLPHLY